MNDYPRMLYRPGSGPSEVWGELVDTKIVHSPVEEAQDLKNGWIRQPDLACKRAKRRRNIKDKLHWLGQHWQFWITSAIATAGVIVAFLAIK